MSTFGLLSFHDVRLSKNVKCLAGFQAQIPVVQARRPSCFFLPPAGFLRLNLRGVLSCFYPFMVCVLPRWFSSLGCQEGVTTLIRNFPPWFRINCMHSSCTIFLSMVNQSGVLHLHLDPPLGDLQGLGPMTSFHISCCPIPRTEKIPSLQFSQPPPADPWKKKEWKKSKLEMFTYKLSGSSDKLSVGRKIKKSQTDTNI